MNEAGVLGRFIPDFGRVVGMMQFSMYHHYTVDEHLLRTRRRLERDRGRTAAGKTIRWSAKSCPASPTAPRSIVAAFLHDIAKGRGEDHSIAGAEVARRLCPRLGLSAADTERVAWLVEQHLTMSNMAQGRDLSDPRTAESLAATVQTLERLRLLLALTVCDIRAVGPGVWNGWKGQLLRNLFWETEVVLGGGHSAIDRKSRVAAAQEALRRALLGWSDPEFDAYAARHYPAYWLKVDLARQIAHAKLFYAMAAEVRSLDHRGRDRRVPRRDRIDDRRARPSPPPLDHRRRLRRRGGQYRRRADLHDDRRLRRRHDLRVPRLRPRRGRIAARRAHGARSSRRCAARSRSARSSPPGIASKERTVEVHGIAAKRVGTGFARSNETG